MYVNTDSRDSQYLSRYSISPKKEPTHSWLGEQLSELFPHSLTLSGRGTSPTFPSKTRHFWELTIVARLSSARYWLDPKRKQTSQESERAS
ncbi:hypothetical protein CEXT_673211 [Caerostris extrusa]|uniref:Ycf15 n=1 Tax=Caerostris extrusa TaxID=172846 RepID=A0AAV4MDP6_CAEEX|nr:hypothetical protein CEXT_673211 [Caerostris extrusa]